VPRDRITLECRDVHHAFGSKPVLFEVNLEVVRGEIVGFVGPSGCGKSTLLNSIVGTLRPQRGEIVVYAGANGKVAMPVDGPGRDRGIVYQNYSLFPFLTAEENVAVGLMFDQTNIPFRFFRYFRWRRLRKQHLEEARAFLKKLGLEDATTRYPSELSGGMQQRVAIAQALIMKPAIVLLDEPFGALDEATREELQGMLLGLYEENFRALANGALPPYTIIIVTHELNEALYVGDRVVGLSQYWDWAGEGHSTCPGATIVYDMVAPVSAPGEPIDHERYDAQRIEIRRAVFEADCLQPRHTHVRFWDQVREGLGEGVLQ
jgi:NitT/TauT family transport system ATP-binding protein